MRKIIKLALIASIFSVITSPGFSSDEEGVDLSSLLGGSTKQKQTTISDLLLQQVPENNMSESTDKLIPVFGKKADYSVRWIGPEKDLVIGISYDPEAQATNVMQSFRTVDQDLSSALKLEIQELFFPSGEFSYLERRKIARMVNTKTEILNTLTSQKHTLEFFSAHPELFGVKDISSFLSKDLEGAVTLPYDFTQKEIELDQNLLRMVVQKSEPIEITYAFQRTDGILRGADQPKEKKFGNDSRRYVFDKLRQGTVTFSFDSIAKSTEITKPGSRVIRADSRLSQVLEEFEAEVINVLELFITAASMKSGVLTSSNMHL